MRSALVGRAFGRDAVQGSVYYGSCNGRYWAIARLEGGADGVFKDVRSTDPRRLGSIATTKCKVPYGLLKLWRQADNCIAASSDPSADPDDPQSTVKIPDPNPPASEPPTSRPRDPSANNDRYPSGDSRRRYPNGRTYIEQVNWCNLMRQQGVPCTVPAPP